MTIHNDPLWITIGWRVRRPTGKKRPPFEYATGAGTWAEKRRAFLFTTLGNPTSAKGLNDGLRWAREHRSELLTEDDAKRTRTRVVRVKILRRSGL